MSEEKFSMEVQMLQDEIKFLKLQLASQKETKETVIVGDEGLQTEFFDCICKDSHDLLRFVFMDDKEYPEIWSEVHLTQQTFWKRCVYAFKYVFLNYQSRFGAFGSWSMNVKDCNKMKDMLDKFQLACKNSSLRGKES